MTTRWPGSRPSDDLDHVGPLGRPGDDPSAGGRSAVGQRQEDHLDLAVVLHGRPGDDHRLVLRLDLDPRLAELVGAEPPAGVGQLRADPRRCGSSG